jgi:DNA-binding MarR family transcriptional regulator
MSCALAEVMQVAAFDIKHGHLSSLRVTRLFTQPHGLTPARLDMLRAIWDCPSPVLQHDVQRGLNALKSVVSVMIRALEELGFITRERYEKDQRTFLIELTAKGKKALRAIFYEMITMGYLNLAIQGAFLSPENPHHLNRFAVVFDRVARRLREFRRSWGRGLPRNPWESNEDEESFYYDEKVADNPNALDLIPHADDDDDFGRPHDPFSNAKVWPT